MALGAVAALKAAGFQPGDVKIITIDGTQGAVQGILDGWISGVIESNPRFGPLAFAALDDFYNGDGVPRRRSSATRSTRPRTLRPSCRTPTSPSPCRVAMPGRGWRRRSCGARATRPGRRSHILRSTRHEGATGDRRRTSSLTGTDDADAGRSRRARSPSASAPCRRSTTCPWPSRPGEVRALVGENGAGKSTLIKIMTGVYQPDDGELRYHGRARPVRPPAGCPGGGHQHHLPGDQPGPAPERGEEPVPGPRADEPPRAHRLPADELRCRAGSWRATASTIDVRRPLQELSVGIQQTVAVARAMNEQHRVVIMDEPTSSLEPREVERLFGVIELLRAEGVARHLRLPSTRRGLPSLRHGHHPPGRPSGPRRAARRASTGRRSSR